MEGSLHTLKYNLKLVTEIRKVHHRVDGEVHEIHLLGYLILGVALKQLRLLHGRVGDSTIVENSLSPQMSQLVEDAIAS